MTIVERAEIPSASLLKDWMHGSQFHDAWSLPLRNRLLSATEIFLRASAATPSWVGALMAIRNAVVKRLGLKDVGSMRHASRKPAEAFRVGDRLGIFRIMAMSDSELLLGIDDRHLDVRVSVMKCADARAYVVSTVVKVHNVLGHLYMIPVGRIHPRVVRAMMRRVAL